MLITQLKNLHKKFAQKIRDEFEIFSTTCKNILR